MNKKPKITVEYKGPSIFEVAKHVHEKTARYCEYCGALMSLSDINDYGSLCERCYTKEYYD